MRGVVDPSRVYPQGGWVNFVSSNITFCDISLVADLARMTITEAYRELGLIWNAMENQAGRNAVSLSQV